MVQRAVVAAVTLAFVLGECLGPDDLSYDDAYPVDPFVLVIKDHVVALVGKEVAMIGWCCVLLAFVLHFAYYEIFTAPGGMRAQPSVSGSKTVTH